MTRQIFGDYEDGIESDLTHMEIVLNANSMELRWNQCNLMADFMAAYYASRFPETVGENGMLDRNDMVHSIGYIVNELVENAIKFRLGGDISVQSAMLEGEIAFIVTNRIAADGTPAFQKLLSDLTDGDPGELLIQKLEANVMGGDGGSGIGFLTMMNDYSTKLGWQFEPCADDGDAVVLRTMARLNIRKEQ